MTKGAMTKASALADPPVTLRLCRAVLAMVLMARRQPATSANFFIVISSTRFDRDASNKFYNIRLKQ